MLLLKFLKEIKILRARTYVIKKDFKKYKSVYAGREQGKGKIATAARNIIVYSHVIEKGLSHNEIKPLFGYQKASTIAKSLDIYWSNGGRDKYLINLAVSTLKEYNRINKERGVNPDKLFIIPKEIECSEIIDIGASEWCVGNLFDITPGTIEKLVSRRHSIRPYDLNSLPISLDDIIECIKIAQNCPSACNRQAVRVKILLKPEDIRSVCAIQGGSEGFGSNSGAVLVITVDLSLYEPSERRIPMFDCGLFTMNLVYALLEKKIGTCILNGSFTSDREKKMQEIVPIPSNEMYAVLISLSKFPAEEKIKIAKSPKRSVDEIISVV